MESKPININKPNSVGFFPLNKNKPTVYMHTHTQKLEINLNITSEIGIQIKHHPITLHIEVTT